MKSLFKKGALMLTSLLCLSSVAKADKGMWLLNELNKENVQKMKELGFKLSVDSLYNLQKPSVANSVVIFGDGCTGVTVSQQGLIMTNHHCGFSAIQSQSTVDHDYLRDGFVSQKFEEELPIAGLTVKYLADIKDVTKTILERVKNPKDETDRLRQIGVAISDLVKQENTRLKDEHKEVIIRPYYAGNAYYMITYNVFTDVRMVFAPPSSIGKFGGDTDNWMYPRHTGDFSVFRVYASKDNKPADFSKDNVPYKPVYVAAVSTEGYKEGDYSMTIGFPGSTERYIPSWGIESMMENSNAPRIEVRGLKQDIWRKAMDADQATRIKYADKYAHSSNYWKNSIGMNRGIQRLDVLGRKRAEEANYQAWIKKTGKKEYDVLGDLSKSYKESGAIMRYQTYASEALFNGIEIISIMGEVMSIDPKDPKLNERLDEIYKDYIPSLDKKVTPVMLTTLKKRLPKELTQEFFNEKIKGYGSIQGFVNEVFSKSIFVSKDKVKELFRKNEKEITETISKDPAMLLLSFAQEIFQELRADYMKYRDEIRRGNRLYFAGRRLMSPNRLMPSDANFTMRMSYGSIKGYNPADATHYNYFTTPQGLLEKYEPNSTEFDLTPDYLKLIKSKDWGRWADKKNGQLYVNFISTNDITGGNSGSPMFDKNGRVIGLAFDGNWEAMSGDIEFEPELQRTIGVDIRYVLFVIDKWGHCPRLIKELDLR